MGIWGSLKKVIDDNVLEDTAKHSIRTNISGKYVDSMINNRVGYKSVILTPEALIAKNTYLTYLLKIENESIESYEIKNELIGKRVKLNLKIQESDKFFEFSTNQVGRWIQEFEKLKIKEKISSKR